MMNDARVSWTLVAVVRLGKKKHLPLFDGVYESLKLLKSLPEGGWKWINTGETETDAVDSCSFKVEMFTKNANISTFIFKQLKCQRHFIELSLLSALLLFHTTHPSSG